MYFRSRTTLCFSINKCRGLGSTQLVFVTLLVMTILRIWERFVCMRYVTKLNPDL